MDKIIAKHSIPTNEYWNFITSTLSSYEVKKISKDGTVKKRLVNDDYFLVNDSWNVNDIGRIPNFQEQFKQYKGTQQNIRFSAEKSTINLELKFILYHKLFNDELRFSSLFIGYSTNLNKLIPFLNEKYPRLSSLLELNMEKTEKKWIWWLNNQGIKTTQIIERKYEGKSAIAAFFRFIYETLSERTDTREEWEKDRWDVRVLNAHYGVNYNISKTQYYLHFTEIDNVVFRSYVKKYIKTRLLGGRFSWGTAQKYLETLPRFLNFISEKEPNWNDLNGLTRKHIEDYLEHLWYHARNNKKRKGGNLNSYVFDKLKCVYTFLKDTQRFDYSIAPEISTSKLLYSEDYPKRDKKSDDDIDYIPDHVLEQLFEHINDLHSDVQPVVWVAYKSGLRISDVLGLTQDCLVLLNGNYSIKTDIEKTYVKGHKIPIDEKLADMLAVLIHNSEEYSNEDNNPMKYIFVRYKGSRKGKPFAQSWVQRHLNKLAIEKNITDEMGNLFHFKNHQFRHTYAVKMLNGGADILTVQELLAHASPEMTLRYARLLDDTKRKEFEKVVKQGVFSFDLNGEIHQVSEAEDIPEDVLDMLWRDEKLNALDNPYGTCKARVHGKCPHAAEPPCLTKEDGKPCFDLAVGMNSFDIKKYELHIESTTKMMEASKEYGREDMVKANQKNLERLQSIYEKIKGGGVIYGKTDRLERKLERMKRVGAKG